MNCFNHQTESAVGICKSCNKGLCAKCAVEVGSGLACKGDCEALVGQINTMIANNIKMSPKAQKIVNANNLWSAPLLYLTMGALFTYFGISNPPRSGDGMFNFLTLFGMMFLFFGVMQIAARFGKPTA